MKNDSIKHIVRFGTVAEKQKLIDLLHTYDILCINGNSTAYMANAISKLITSNIKGKGKAYIIDPITYAFQGDVKLLKSKDKDTLKKSIKSLIEIYGSPIKEIIESDHSICPNDFSKCDKEEFCRKVIDFQVKTVQSYLNDNGYSKYLEYISISNMFDPDLIIAPYFYLNDQDTYFNDWLELNVEFYNLAKKNITDKKVFAELVISKTILNNKILIKRIKDKYLKLNCDGIAIWIDSFDEHIEPIEILKGFIDLLRAFKDKKVYIMYGVFLSILLTHRELGLISGVSHGLEYGESRAVYPVGGGLPVSKYYFYPLHHRINTPNATHILLDMGIISNGVGDYTKYKKEICNCEFCEKLLNNDMRNFVVFESKEYYEITRKKTETTYRRTKADKSTKEACLEHYMYCKQREFDEAKSKSLDILINELRGNYKQFAKYNYILDDKCDYLERWASALEYARK